MIRHSLALALAFVAAMPAGCQRGGGGPLVPVEATGVSVADGAAVVTRPPVIARVTARWAAIGQPSVRITWRNTGNAPVSIDVAALRMMHGSDEGALRTAVDVTGVDLTDARSDNDEARTLVSLDEPARLPAALEVPPGAERAVDADFTSFGDGVTVAAGDRIVLRLPVAAGSTEVTFTAGKPALSPF